MNDKTAKLYDTLVQEGGDLALSKEECETSEGLVHLLEDTEQSLAKVEKSYFWSPQSDQRRQAVQTEIRFLFMSMNLTKLAKNLALRTLNTQKPHSDFIILIVFKTEIVVWFYYKASFCPTSFFLFSLNTQ